MAAPRPPNVDLLVQRSLQDESEERALASDEEALAAFCEQVELSEIDFVSWQACHQDLNIRLSLSLSREEAFLAGERVVSYVRTRRSLLPSGKLGPRQKEKVSRRISWESVVGPQTTIRLPGEGDAEGKRAGDLCVTLQIPRG